MATKMTTNLDSVISHISIGMTSIIEEKLKSHLKKESDVIIEKIAKEMAQGLSGSIESWNDFAQENIQIVINIDGVCKAPYGD